MGFTTKTRQRWSFFTRYWSRRPIIKSLNSLFVFLFSLSLSNRDFTLLIQTGDLCQTRKRSWPWFASTRYDTNRDIHKSMKNICTLKMWLWSAYLHCVCVRIDLFILSLLQDTCSELCEKSTFTVKCECYLMTNIKTKIQFKQPIHEWSFACRCWWAKRWFYWWEVV